MDVWPLPMQISTYPPPFMAPIVMKREQLTMINWRKTSDVYISHCDKAPFAGSQIHLFKGCNNDLSKKLQERRPLLLTFLKGSKKAKASLKEQHPLLYWLLKFGSWEPDTWSRNCQANMCFSYCPATKKVVHTPSVCLESQKPSTVGTKGVHLYLSFQFLFLTLTDRGETKIVHHVLDTAVVTT